MWTKSGEVVATENFPTFSREICTQKKLYGVIEDKAHGAQLIVWDFSSVIASPEVKRAKNKDSGGKSDSSNESKTSFVEPSGYMTMWSGALKPKKKPKKTFFKLKGNILYQFKSDKVRSLPRK